MFFFTKSRDPQRSALMGLSKKGKVQMPDGFYSLTGGPSSWIYPPRPRSPRVLVNG